MRIFYSGMFRCALRGIRMLTAEPVDMMLSYAYLRDEGQDQLATLRRIARERSGVITTTPDKGKVVGLRNPVNCRSHFLDCGAFTQRKRALQYAKKTGKGEFAFYETNEFWDYVWDYCHFVKANAAAIEHYSTLDVIPNAELTWKVQKYMEDQHGLRPVPVVHYRSDLKWLRHYINRGHDFISLGGVSGKTKNREARRWIDAAFAMCCPESRSGNTPMVKLHGFGLSRFDTMTAWPWYSCDSSTWTTTASFGDIFVPVKRGGKLSFAHPPHVISTAENAVLARTAGRHYFTISSAERKVVDEWLEQVGVPLGEMDVDGDIKTYGVINRHSERRAVNYAAFEGVRKALPAWPWAWPTNSKSAAGGLGLAT